MGYGLDTPGWWHGIPADVLGLLVNNAISVVLQGSLVNPSVLFLLSLFCDFFL